MFSPKGIGYNSSPSGSSYYGFSSPAGNTFTKPSPAFESVNSSPGVEYIGSSSPDNQAHVGLGKNRETSICPIIGTSNGNPVQTEDGGVRCSYEFEDFQDVSDLQTYADTFGQDEGFHETMKEFCHRSSSSCFGGDTPDSKSGLCTNLSSVGEVGDICRSWASQNPSHLSSSRGYESSGSRSTKNSKSSYSSRRSSSSNSSYHGKQKKHGTKNNHNVFWFIVLVVILLVIIGCVYMDYRRRYNGGFRVGGKQ